MTQQQHQTLLRFKKEGLHASFNYADDTTSEWAIGDRHKAKALDLFDNNPDLQDKMREIAKGFLWTLTMDRPV